MSPLEIQPSKFSRPLRDARPKATHQIKKHFIFMITLSTLDNISYKKSVSWKCWINYQAYAQLSSFINTDNHGIALCCFPTDAESLVQVVMLCRHINFQHLKLKREKESYSSGKTAQRRQFTDKWKAKAANPIRGREFNQMVIKVPETIITDSFGYQHSSKCWLIFNPTVGF